MILNVSPWRRTEIIVVFEIASKYCISDSFVDHDGYSISSEGFLPAVVDIMVIRVKFTHSSPFPSQDGWVMLENSDKMWSTGEGNGKPLQYCCLENPMNSMKRQNDRILKEVFPGSLGAQYAAGDQWRNNSRKNEGMKPKQKQYPAVDVTGDRSKI